MIITNQIRNSIVSQLYKIMRITTKYDYIPDDRLKKQLLIKEQACLDNSLTIHEYLEKINFIIYSINKDTGMNTAPIRFEDLSLPKPNIHRFTNSRFNFPVTNNPIPNVNVRPRDYSVINPNTSANNHPREFPLINPNTSANNHPQDYSVTNRNTNVNSHPREYPVYNTFQVRGYPPNPITRKREETERRSTNTGVKSAFNQVYDIYTLTQSQESLRSANLGVQHNASSKQIKNNLVSNAHNMNRHNTQPQSTPLSTPSPKDTIEKETPPKRRAGLQEAKDAVVDLLNTSIETNGVSEDISDQVKQKFNNKNFQKLIDSYSIEQFCEEIKDTKILPAELNDIKAFNTKLLQLSYKIRLLLIEAGNPRDFNDYKKIRNIFEYQIENTNYIFIDDFFLKEAEEFIYELSNKSRRILIKEQNSLKLEETYDTFIENILNR